MGSPSGKQPRLDRFSRRTPARASRSLTDAIPVSAAGRLFKPSAVERPAGLLICAHRMILTNVELEIPMNRYQSALAWSHDGRRLAVGLSHGKVFVHEVPRDRSEIRSTNCGPAEFFEWGPAGNRFAFKTGGDLRLGRGAGGAPAPARVGASIFMPDILSLSPDGELLAGADRDGTLPIWNIASGEIIKRLPGHPHPIADAPGDKGNEVNAIV